MSRDKIQRGKAAGCESGNYQKSARAVFQASECVCVCTAFGIMYSERLSCSYNEGASGVSRYDGIDDTKSSSQRRGGPMGRRRQLIPSLDMITTRIYCTGANCRAAALIQQRAMAGSSSNNCPPDLHTTRSFFSHTRFPRSG